MKKHHLLLCLIVAGLTGCTTIQPPPARVSAVTVAKAPGQDVHILDAYISETDGHLAVCGRAKQAFKWTRIVPTHVDVQFLDANGQQLALKNVPIQLNKGSRHSYPYPASFQIPSEPWPQATVRILVSAHEGATHQP